MSESITSQRVNVLRIFDAFRDSTDERRTTYTDAFDNLPAEIICARLVYQQYAEFLVEEYIIPPGVRNAGQRLKCNTVLDYLGCLLNIAFMIFGTVAQHAMFFTARDGSNVTDDARWFQGVKRNIKRAICERMMHGADFYEGIRAVLIDRDQKPVWNPATVGDVADAAVRAVFFCGRRTTGLSIAAWSGNASRLQLSTSHGLMPAARDQTRRTSLGTLNTA